MKKVLIVITLLFCIVSCQKNKTEDVIFTKGTKAPNIHHTGDVWLNRISEADSTFNYNIVVASFEPNAKLDWHVHPDGQQLLIIEGTGYYQERGKPVQILQKGDVVKSLPGVEHWHSSTPNTKCTYLAIYGGAPTKWLEKLTDQEYKDIEP
ncbi:cupin [Dokdonia pacifica]|uniref:Cupin domain protein n=1 Tax=Dokdonia pacifica TaxID=1627892 RepID=A0A239CXD7_9FLAO|nr:cupin domain-containing protein [Dokdonia pacifica]GGG04486.1 cupin [Dokdonia pacifica]SNS24770.1 Cupin domain protein [Dokdonia pacifica]